MQDNILYQGISWRQIHYERIKKMKENPARNSSFSRNDQVLKTKRDRPRIRGGCHTEPLVLEWIRFDSIGINQLNHAITLVIIFWDFARPQDKFELNSTTLWLICHKCNEIRVNAFRRSTIPQKQFIIMTFWSC